MRVETPDRGDIAVYLVGDEVYATEDRCSHGSAALTDGYLEGYEVVCPFHLGRFDVRTGEPTLEPCVYPIRSFKVAVQGDDVLLADEEN